MQTRKQLISEKYLILKSELGNYIESNLFPSLDDYDITDIIVYLNYYFPKNQEEEYTKTIEKLMKQQENINLSYNDFSITINLILDFIKFLNNI